MCLDIDYLRIACSEEFSKNCLSGRIYSRGYIFVNNLVSCLSCGGKYTLKSMRSEDVNRFACFMIASETIDLFLDWDFVYEINKSPEKVDESSRQLILGFAIWGTILYFLTFLSLCCDLCNDEDEENPCSPWLSLLSTVTEDFPQTILAIAVAGHITHLISWVQIAKAVYGFIEPFVRVNKLFNEREKSKKTFSTASHDYECQKSADMFFCGVLCLFSLALFSCYYGLIYETTQ